MKGDKHFPSYYTYASYVQSTKMSPGLELGFFTKFSNLPGTAFWWGSGEQYCSSYY